VGAHFAAALGEDALLVARSSSRGTIERGSCR
jgi:hypothetical protein